MEKIIWSIYIKSNSNKDKKYFVRLTENGEWLCGCKAFLFRGKCNHIEKAKNIKMKGSNECNN